MLGFQRGAVSRWLHEADDITVAYRANYLQWTIIDAAFPGLQFQIEVVPTVGISGMAVQVVCHGALPDDHVIWGFGGCEPACNPNHDYDPVVHGDRVTARGFVADDCRGNVVELEDHSFRLGHQRANGVGTIGRCSAAEVTLLVADASQAHSPAALLASSGGQLPLLAGCAAASRLPITWVLWGLMPDQELPNIKPAMAFAAGLQVCAELAARVQVHTPEPRVDALASASASTAAIDGLWYPPVFVPSAMLWNSPYPGWRTMFGATMYGWHERVICAAKTYLASQITVSDKVSAHADPQRHLAIQSEQSRFYGVGRVTLHAGMYDMQSQFFDQLISAWRATADAELETVLRPALDLHLEWLRECFDPDGDGLYESYINTWPTDSVWYNGGGSAEATSYAFRGHAAARDMARRADDSAAQEFHQAALERIRNGFFTRLWSASKGHPGKCREQGGHQRLHDDPWLYSIFLPIDAGLLTQQQAASALHYSRYALQNDAKPFGGRMVWFSSWVPGIWSVRYDWPADCYHLALAFFQSGLAADGWDVFKGTFLSSAYELSGLGNLGHLAGGTDFGDCSNTFARTLVEGLFGYRPDYPNHCVTIAPGFPPAWDHASITLPDVVIAYRRAESRCHLDVRLTRPAQLVVRLPVRAREVLRVTVDGQVALYQTQAGFSETVIEVRLSERTSAVIELFTSPELDALVMDHPADSMEVRAGDSCTFHYDEGPIIAVHDAQGVLNNISLVDGRLQAHYANNPGHHLVFVTLQVGSLTQVRTIFLHLSDPSAERRRNAATCTQASSQTQAQTHWRHVQVNSLFNADVRTIFQQRYVSPRPDTVSLRIGDDGWSPWTASFWNSKPPTITLDRLADLGPDTPLITPQGAEFLVSSSAKNIAFASLWDNYPSSITVPVSAAGEVLWLLICGSTNPMQCHIANASIRILYHDGQTESFELTPPHNFWALAPIAISGAAPGQGGRADYTHPIDAFCVPAPHPAHVWLGENCRAMVYGRRLRPGVSVTSVTLETLSQEVVIGVMAVSVMNVSGVAETT